MVREQHRAAMQSSFKATRRLNDEHPIEEAEELHELFERRETVGNIVLASRVLV